MLEVLVTTGAIIRSKLQSNHHHQQTNTGCPSCRPSDSAEALKERFTLSLSLSVLTAETYSHMHIFYFYSLSGIFVFAQLFHVFWSNFSFSMAFHGQSNTLTLWRTGAEPSVQQAVILSCDVGHKLDRRLSLPAWQNKCKGRRTVIKTPSKLYYIETSKTEVLQT